MTRLLVHVEGETEEAFVNELLARHLGSFGYENVSARLFGNARQRDRRGGVRPWATVLSDITRHLKNDRGCIATLMVDYYGMPSSDQTGWPGRAAAAGLPFAQRGPSVQQRILSDVAAKMGEDFDQRRFVPFVLMHEFEALLFSDCTAFARAIAHPHLTPNIQAIRNQFNSPEEINDSPETAPSKRIESLVPEYQKPLYGNLAALEIGLAKMRDQCPHFADWLIRLESAARVVRA